MCVSHTRDQSALKNKRKLIVLLIIHTVCSVMTFSPCVFGQKWKAIALTVTLGLHNSLASSFVYIIPAHKTGEFMFRSTRRRNKDNTMAKM